MLYIALSEDRDILGAGWEKDDILTKICMKYMFDYPKEVINIRENDHGFFDIYRNGNLYDSFNIETAELL